MPLRVTGLYKAPLRGVYTERRRSGLVECTRLNPFHSLRAVTGLLVLIGLLVSISTKAQITGGNGTFKFVTIPTSARIAATGGINNSMYDADVSFFTQNPALLNAAQHGRLHLQQNFYLIGTNQLTAAYGRSISKIGWTGAALQYVNYGDFDVTNESGVVEGTVKANDLMFSLGAARPITEQLSYGVSAKYTRSKYAEFTGEAFMADVGFAFADSSRGLVASLVGKNIGTEVNHFYPGNNEDLPFDIQFGISKRLKHTPFLFSVNLHHLTTWDIRYDDPALRTTDAFITDTTTKEKTYFADKLLRHAVIGSEIYLGKVLRVNLGYNHLRRKEMGFDERRSLSGFSFGVQLALRKWGVSYAYSLYNVATQSNHFSLYLNTGEFIPKLNGKKLYEPRI